MEAGAAAAAEAAAQPPPVAADSQTMDVCLLEDEMRAEDYDEPEEKEDSGTEAATASAEAPAAGQAPAVFGDLVGDEPVYDQRTLQQLDPVLVADGRAKEIQQMAEHQ
eukprot:8369460-Alexandrium_andersonii.AAC.1